MVSIGGCGFHSSQYGMTFTLLACETPPSSYEAELAVRIGRSVNSVTRTPHAADKFD